MSETEIKGLVERMQAGDRVALARLMTLVENRAPGLPGPGSFHPEPRQPRQPRRRRAGDA
ncbi:MAG: hypothetical protein E6J81_19275 [Deltaproteobacteria bacterium]|nr:MAG: hypothetical protein E6J81_19275 [Deltaproteobacteria bacterium]